MHLGVAGLFVVAFTASLAAVGAPAIPSAGLVTMLIVLQAVNLGQYASGALCCAVPHCIALLHFQLSLGDGVTMLIVLQAVNLGQYASVGGPRAVVHCAALYPVVLLH